MRAGNVKISRQSYIPVSEQSCSENFGFGKWKNWACDDACTKSFFVPNIFCAWNFVPKFCRHILLGLKICAKKFCSSFYANKYELSKIRFRNYFWAKVRPHFTALPLTTVPKRCTNAYLGEERTNSAAFLSNASS